MYGRPARRLPGVQIESRPRRLPEVLPRMDVAAFVGFAAAGPLHTPVVVEDATTFADLFGDDAPLAWDRERCELVRASLGPAVRAFFRNGGQRCWVVRVAGDRAIENRFPVPGLLRRRGGELRPTFASARSEGSWSDRLGVASSLAVTPASVDGIGVDGTRVVSARLGAPDAIARGDLLRLTWLPSQDALLVPVVSVDGGVATLDGDAAWWLPAGPPAPGAWTAAWFPRDDAPAEALPTLLAEPTWSAGGGVTLTFAGDAAPEPGHFVCLERTGEQVWVVIDDKRSVVDAGSPPGPGSELSGRFVRVAPASDPPPGLLAGPPPVGERLRLELWVRKDGGHAVRLGDLGLAAGHPRYLGALPADRRLFEADEDLLTPSEQALRDRVRALVGDGTDLRAHHADLWQEVAIPRFPLAVDAGEPDLFLPVIMLVVPDAFLGAQPTAAGAAVRDGLAAFGAAPFLDPDLADETTESLPARADFVRWQQPAPRRLRGIHALLPVDEVTLVAVPDAAQRGWSTEVAAVAPALATPALAVTVIDPQGTFRLDWTDVDPDAAYVLERAGDADFHSPEAVLLPVGTTRTTVTLPAPGRRWCRVRAYLPRPPAPLSYFEVADAEAVGSFWSDPVELVAPVPQFADCDDTALGVPALALAAGPDANGSYRLAWTAVPRALAYRVEESADLDFTDTTVVYAGAALDVTIYGRPPGRYQYRVRAEGRAATVLPPVWLGDTLVAEVTDVGTPRHVLLAAFPGAIGQETVFDGDAFSERFLAGSRRDALAAGFRYQLVRDDVWPGPPTLAAYALDATGAWSDGVTVRVPSPERLVLLPVAAYAAGPKQVLLSVQAALARLCAARGDILSVLALPEHYRENEAVRHVTELRARLPEEAPWSYAALYHPWLLVEADPEPRRAPPDGATCGVMAARAALRGAWIAPANQPLGDVLGLVREVERDQWLRLLEAHVNLVRQEPHGFLSLAADTLATDPDLTPINVRRLLALLRRAALRLGPTFVFEPNNDTFRRSVEREFESLLSVLYRAGAFAGETAARSFQVVVDASDNPPASIDQGRFIVELKVAPSLPMSFITVRLVQSDDRSQVTEVR